MKIIFQIIIFLCFSFQIKAQDISDTIYTVVEKQAEFPGGLSELGKYFHKHINSCNEPQYLSCSTYYFKFVIDKSGKATRPSVNSNCGVCDAMTQSLIKATLNMPQWEPALMKGKTVASYINLPIKMCFLR